MYELVEKLRVARDVAVEREPDIRLKEILRAMSIVQAEWQLYIDISVNCHFRSWHRSVTPAGMRELRDASADELAQTLSGWIQDALDGDLLSLSNPPLNGGASLANLAVSNVVTFIYDKDFMLVGKKWA